MNPKVHFCNVLGSVLILYCDVMDLPDIEKRIKTGTQ